MSNTVDNPYCTRLWTTLYGHKPASMRRLGRRNRLTHKLPETFTTTRKGSL